MQGAHLARVVDHPQGVTDAVAGDEVDPRLTRDDTRDDRVDVGRAPTDEEDRLVLRPERVDVPHAVELLVGPGELVDAHPAEVVVGHRHRGDHAGLHDVCP